MRVQTGSTSITKEVLKILDWISKNYPDKVFYTTGFYTGMRPGEILGLKSAIDFKNKRIEVTRGDLENR